MEFAGSRLVFDDDAAVLPALLVHIRIHHRAVLHIDLTVDLHPDRVILALLSHVQVDGVVVGRELVALEKLNRGLIKLQHDDFMQ